MIVARLETPWGRAAVVTPCQSSRKRMKSVDVTGSISARSGADRVAVDAREQTSFAPFGGGCGGLRREMAAQHEAFALELQQCAVDAAFVQ